MQCTLMMLGQARGFDSKCPAAGLTLLLMRATSNEIHKQQVQHLSHGVLANAYYT